MDWAPLALSFQVATLATLVASVFAIALAVLLARRNFWGRDFLDALCTAPMVMPPTVLGYYVLLSIGRHSALGRLYEAVIGSPLVFTRTGAVLAAAIGSFPLVVKSARAALEGVDRTLLQAARTLGAGPVRLFFAVHMPLAARGLIAAVALAFARALGDFGITLMVAGDIPGETQTASLAIYDAIQGQSERQAAGMVAVLTGLAVATLYLVNKLSKRHHVV